MRMPILDTPARKIAAGAFVAVDIAIVVVVVLLVTGGGGGGDSTPRSAARATVEEFVDDLGQKRFSDACGLLTDELRRQLGGNRCGEALTALAGEAGTPPTVEITDVRVAGNKAAIDAAIDTGSAVPAEHTLGLLEQAGVWRISSLGG